LPADDINNLTGRDTTRPSPEGRFAADMADVMLLQTVPGAGLITATALVALVTDIRRFPSGRHFTSFLG
jgi:transposase